jgi:hypothetical protein
MTQITSPDSTGTSASEAQQTPPQTPQTDSSGFYRLQGDTLIYAPNEVHAPGYSLSRSTRAATALPKDGWDWFDSAEAAYAHHNLPLPQPAQPGRHRGPEPRGAGGSSR